MSPDEITAKADFLIAENSRLYVLKSEVTGQLYQIQCGCEHNWVSGVCTICRAYSSDPALRRLIYEDPTS